MVLHGSLKTFLVWFAHRDSLIGGNCLESWVIQFSQAILRLRVIIKINIYNNVLHQKNLLSWSKVDKRSTSYRFNFYSQIIVHYSRVLCSRIDIYFLKIYFAFVMIGSCRADRKWSGNGIRKGPQAWDAHSVIVICQFTLPQGYWLEWIFDQQK